MLNLLNLLKVRKVLELWESGEDAHLCAKGAKGIKRINLGIQGEEDDPLRHRAMEDEEPPCRIGQARERATAIAREP